MYVKHSYPQEFTDLMMHLRAKLPEELLVLDGISDGHLDIHESSKRFFNNNSAVADASIDSNANVADHSVINYNFEIGKALMKFNSYYNIWKYLKQEHGLETANKIIEMQLSGDIYINDAWDVGRPYCFNYSTYDIALEGLKMGDRIQPLPPKSLYSFVRQVEQFTVYAANSTLGATGLADLLIVISYYVERLAENHVRSGESGKSEVPTIFGEPHYRFASMEDAWSYVREVLASLIYTLNWQFRGNQSPFTNVSLYDDEFLNEMLPEYRFADGWTPSKTTVKQVQKLFMEVMNEELRRAPVTFPVTTACFAVDDDKNIIDEDFAQLVAEQNLEFGFINIYCGKSSTLSSCCRLRSDKDNEYFNSFGAGSSKIGSLGVVTMNLPRMAVRHKDEPDPVRGFFDGVLTLVRVCAAVNNAKRKFLAKRIRDGVLPLYDLGFMDLKRQYSTCGVTGLYEACEILGYDMTSQRGQEFVMQLLQKINAMNDSMAESFNAPHNCEQVPAENSSVKLARKDAVMGYEHDATGHYYSNQFIPLIVNADMLDRIKLQGKFDSEFSGGAICHLNVAERIEDPKKIVKLIKQCAKKGVVYWAINYRINRCAYGHMSVGSSDKCGVCGNPVEDTFTRVVGFLTNTKHWHEVRRHHDWPHRQFYDEV